MCNWNIANLFRKTDFKGKELMIEELKIFLLSLVIIIPALAYAYIALKDKKELEKRREKKS